MTSRPISPTVFVGCFPGGGNPLRGRLRRKLEGSAQKHVFKARPKSSPGHPPLQSSSHQASGQKHAN
eukprot:5121860-Alexandrium_andersonii.AAC.1